MKLAYLTEGLKCEIYGGDCEISAISLYDYECKDGSIFFCIKGNNADGENYPEKAVKNGAVAIVAMRYIDCGVPCVVVKDVRKALTWICKRFYSEPQKRLKTIGVVGTDGKTSVCEIMCSILTNSGIKCGRIGTSGAWYDGKTYDTGMTTPDPPVLYAILSDMANRGEEAVCMELSAHAIYYKKADFMFDILVFTNCTRDHLDFFGSVEKYRCVKASAFSHKNCRLAVVNADDPLGVIIAMKRKSGTITYGIEQPSDVFALDVNESADGTKFLINLFDRLYDVESRLVGRFNVYNLLAVTTACALYGLKTDKIAEELSKILPVNGRMQKVHSKPDVYVDYAHTPGGLENALSVLKRISEGRVICVFGCGGNRDEGKRRLMGETSGKLADLTVVTCDNPRFEDSSAIIREIESGLRNVQGSEYVTVSDRKQAIEFALQSANPDDTVLIAGKGAENYQDIMGVKQPFSDEEIALTFYDKKRV